MSKIQIIVGTVMGQALEVAKTLETELTGQEHQVRITTVFEKSSLDDADEKLIICTSNTGMGDLPANIVPFYLHLVNNHPNIYNRPYALVNLGDSSYPNFAQAGKTMAAALDDLGAKAMTDSLILDAIMVDDYGNEATHWLSTWQNQL